MKHFSLVITALRLSDLSVFVIWVWNGTTQWSCLPGSCSPLCFCWLVSSSCTTSTLTFSRSRTSTTYLFDRLPGEMARKGASFHLTGVSSVANYIKHVEIIYLEVQTTLIIYYYLTDNVAKCIWK